MARFFRAGLQIGEMSSTFSVSGSWLFHSTGRVNFFMQRRAVVLIDLSLYTLSGETSVLSQTENADAKMLAQS